MILMSLTSDSIQKSSIRIGGLRKAAASALGVSLTIVLATTVLPELGMQFDLFGAASIIVLFGYGLTGCYEAITGWPWQNLENWWNQQTPRGQFFKGTLIVTTVCIITGLVLWAISPMLRS